MTFHYQPVDTRGRPHGPERRISLQHRLLDPAKVAALLARAGLTLIASWGGWDGQPIGEETEQHVYLARRGPPPRPPKRTRSSGKGP